jgi:hypothetical protein
MPGHDAVPIRRRREHAFPITYVVVAFAFTWTCWWPAALTARGLITLPLPLVLIGSRGPLVAALAVTALDGGRALRALLARVVDRPSASDASRPTAVEAATGSHRGDDGWYR